MLCEQGWSLRLICLAVDDDEQELLARFTSDLAARGRARDGAHYLDVVERVAAREGDAIRGSRVLTRTVAANLHR